MSFKILAYFAVHGRLDILGVMLKGLKRLQENAPYKITPFAVCSTREESNVLRNHGIRHIIFPNDNGIGLKKNSGILAAMNYEWDYLFELGSDDLVDDRIWDVYRPYIEANTPAFGLNLVAFYDTLTGRQALWVNDYVVGCARMVHRSTFNLMNETYILRYTQTFSGEIQGRRGKIAVMPEYMARKVLATGYAEIIEVKKERFRMWDDKANVTLDHNSEMRMAMAGVFVKVINQPDPLTLDIKSEANIHTFDKFIQYETKTDYLTRYPEADEVRGIRQADRHLQHHNG